MKMTVEMFQKIADVMLRKHFGLSLNDTDLAESDYVEILLGNETRPFEYLNELADDLLLTRIDLIGQSYGGDTPPLAAADEDSATAIAAAA